MFFIKCKFVISEKSPPIDGYAVCSDPDTPVTFIHPNGMPYVGEIWKYSLQHYSPWAKLEWEY